jgi:hypothetical protein
MWLIDKIRARFDRVDSKLEILEEKLRLLQESLGRIESRQNALIETPSFRSQEFKVYSQHGEDGLLQHLIQAVKLPNQTFIEFGVQDYEEANTRFLAGQGGWRGLIIDGDKSAMEQVRLKKSLWFSDLTTVGEFITCENINSLFLENGFSGEIGVLSIDIDGNDFWVWDAINSVSPAVVICEYNHRFGEKLAVTIPYDPSFQRQKAHYSQIYFGASLKALCLLAERKGYDFVGASSSGVNAFFVRKDLRPACLKKLTAEEGYVRGSFMDALDESGRFIRMSAEEEYATVTRLPLVDIEQLIQKSPTKSDNLRHLATISTPELREF